MPNPLRRLLALLGLFAGVSLLAGADAPAPVIWKLDNPAVVGGLKTTVLGSPVSVREADAPPVLRFNGTDTGVVVPTIPIAGAREFSVEIRIRPTAGGPVEQRYLHFEDTAGRRGLCELRLNQPDAWSFDAFVRAGDAQATLHDPAVTHPAGRWTWVAMVYDGKRLVSYVDGVKELERDVAFGPLENGKTSLGVRQTLKSWFQGELAEVRWHRRALAAEELQRVK